MKSLLGVVVTLGITLLLGKLWWAGPIHWLFSNPTSTLAALTSVAANIAALYAGSAAAVRLGLFH